MTASEHLLDELAAMVRGSQRGRRRLLEEIREDLTDAVQAEQDAGLDAATAEAVVVARFGDARTVATRWNRDAAERSAALRRNVVLVLAAAATAGALGVTQHASGKSSPLRLRGCTYDSPNLACPDDREPSTRS